MWPGPPQFSRASDRVKCLKDKRERAHCTRPRGASRSCDRQASAIEVDAVCTPGLRLHLRVCRRCLIVVLLLAAVYNVAAASAAATRILPARALKLASLQVW